MVYAKPPFAGPQQVLDYVGRYTHRVAIANQRLLAMDDGQVRFRYKDSRTTPPQTKQTMTLDATEFMRRFLLHVLPTGFHRIRHYGLLGNRHRRHNLARCRQRLGTTAAPPIARETRPADYRDRYETLTGVSLRACPVCADGHMITTECLRRARPHPAAADSAETGPTSSERRLVKALESGEWRGVGRLAAARARYGRLARATLAAFDERRA